MIKFITYPFQLESSTNWPWLLALSEWPHPQHSTLKQSNDRLMFLRTRAPYPCEYQFSGYVGSE
ncbi:hypothetical protein MSG37_16395 [Shewanella sp. 1CM18E]|uniref:hypothetical protein n=1 Tax=Shewanella sp. 1CM18E TaxID=2929169 RepID=UPI0020BDFA29|nr:hypothetical protein [Shewanella sp. 1CM18E]MCK8046468.1 hypothetical protein [Shewanella sp. 1CM18E]